MKKNNIIWEIYNDYSIINVIEDSIYADNPEWDLDLIIEDTI